MAFFDDQNGYYPDPRADADRSFSPDGKYYAALTHRGVVAIGAMESSAWVFETGSVKKYLSADGELDAQPPKLVARMSAAVNGLQSTVYDANPITRLRWSRDSKHLFFLAWANDSNRRVFEATMGEAGIRQLTPDSLDVAEFAETPGGLVYSATPAVDPSRAYLATGPGLRDVDIGTGVSLFDLLFPNWQESVWRSEGLHLWVNRGGAPAPVVDRLTGRPVIITDTDVFSVSPDGRHLVITAYAERIPLEWEAYETGQGQPGARIIADVEGSEGTVNQKRGVDASRPKQYRMVDTETGRETTLVDAPVGGPWRGYEDNVQAVWSSNGREVVLSDSYIPSRGGSVSRPCVVIVEIANLHYSCIKEYPAPKGRHFYSSDGAVRLDAVDWNKRSSIVLSYGQGVRSQALVAQETYERRGSSWQKVAKISKPGVSDSLPKDARISIEKRETVNDPPTLVAIDTQTGRNRQIFDPNPQLSTVDLGRVEVYKWSDNYGHQLAGGLVYPQNFTKGTRYPLVIQTHGFNPHEFMKGGGYESAHAARALAARGIAVLQVEEPGSPVDPSRRSEESGVGPYLSAIETLSAHGVVDERKVGILGFSYTGELVWKALIDAPNRFCAAALAEADIGSMWSYLENVDYMTGTRADAYASRVGAKPFGAGLTAWIANSAGFNTDKVLAPILFTASDPVGLIYGWDAYAMMRAQQRPVELLYIRNGRHPLTKPAERLASQEMHVDWFDFWLNDHEDRDPAKTQQYVRWRNLRQRVTSGNTTVTKCK